MDVWNKYREQFVKLNTSVLRNYSSAPSGEGMCVCVCECESERERESKKCLFYMDPDVLLLSNESPVNLVDLPSLPFPHSISNVQAKKKRLPDKRGLRDFLRLERPVQ